MSALAKNQASTSGENALPYRVWWGLAGCAALMAAVLSFGISSDGSAFPVDKGNWWYYWQLSEPTVWTRLSAWVPYSIHQLAIWYLIAQGRQQRPRYIFGLHGFNVLAIAVNAFFILLHVAQTRIFYDGLAQDVHELTSMMSVTIMLFLVILMENRRRGMFFGRPLKIANEVGDAVRRYHGYYFSWAIIYTFWYHPVELTSGHIVGFSYMMLLFLQSSLFFTRYHTNRWWTVSLETLFIVHGAIVAYSLMQQGSDAWAMFLFGGMGTFMVTQMHGLGLSSRQKWIIVGAMLTIIVIFYWSSPEGLLNLPRVPAIMLTGAIVMFLLLWPIVRIMSLMRRSSGPPTAA
jgi:hypothetical protein